jgi:integrase/recombinase XerD
MFKSRGGFEPPTYDHLRLSFLPSLLVGSHHQSLLGSVLGHSSLEMTRRYANLMTEDLQAVHQQISLLAA